MKRPNILWICTDQQRFDTLGCTGNCLVRTPHLDRLAAEGVLFEATFVQSPICMPSRASFLTGRYPRTTRLRQNGQTLPTDERILPRLLADDGYRCGLVGKLHLAPADPAVNETIEVRGDDGYEEFNWAGDPHDSWGLHSGYTAFLAERGARFLSTPHPLSPLIEVGMPAELSEAAWCANTAISFIQRHAGGGQPWLFSANIFAPHHPFNPPESYLQRYLDTIDTIPLPDTAPGELAGKPPYQAIDAGGAYGATMGFASAEMSPADQRLVRAAYWAMCDLVDDQVGRILAALDETGQRDDTIVIFMSDHGEMLGDHGIYLKGPYFYDPAIQVPLIMRFPRSLSPGRFSGLVELVDLAPTLLEAANASPYPGMQGRSLWPKLTGGGDDAVHRQSVYCEYYNAMPFHRDPTPQLTMIRTETHKLVVDHSHNGGELYDLQADRDEFKNLWNEPAASAVKTDLLTTLTHRMAWTVDPLPPRQSEW